MGWRSFNAFTRPVAPVIQLMFSLLSEKDTPHEIECLFCLMGPSVKGLNPIEYKFFPALSYMHLKVKE